MTLKKRLSIYIVCIASVINISFFSIAFGGGFDNSAIGIKATGMGFAFTGIADDASAVFYNPAGLVYQEKGAWQVEMYGYYVFTDIQYTANSIEDKSDEEFIIPGFFASKNFGKWAFGVGGYIPFAGGGASYKNFQGSPFKLESSAGWNALTGAIAYKLSPSLSIGWGMSIYIGEMKSQFFDPGLGTVVENDYNGYSGYGVHVGLFYKPVEEIGIGMTVRSEVPIEMEGLVRIAGIETDSEVDFTLPYYLTLGLGYKPAKNLTFSISATYMLWSDLDKIAFTTANIKSEQKTYYTNSCTVGMGIEYVTPIDLIIRSGIDFRQNASEDKGLTPVSCDVDMVGLHMGFAYDITDSIEINIIGAQNFGFEKEYNFAKFNQNGAVIMIGFRKKY